MNRHSPHRSQADLWPVFLIGLLLYLLVVGALAMALGPAGVPAAGPLHAPPGMGF